MDGLVLEDSELLVLLDAVSSPDLIAIDQVALLPNTRQAHESAIESGIEKLKGRGLAKSQNDICVLDREIQSGIVRSSLASGIG